MELGEKRLTVLVFIAASLFGFLGLCTRHLNEYGLSAIDISLVRSLVTFVVMAVVILCTDRSKFRFELKHIWVFALFGFFKFMSDMTLFAAQERVPLAIATLLQMTAPFFVVAISVGIFREKVSSKKIFGMIIAFIGLMMVCDVANGQNDIMFEGTMLGIASGFFFGAYLMGASATSRRKYDSMTTLLYIFLFSVIYGLPFSDVGLVAEAFTDPHAAFHCLMLGVVLTAVPFFIYNYVGSRLSPVVVSSVGLVEAVVAAAVGYFIFDEYLSPLNIFGLCVALGAILAVNIGVAVILERYRKAKELAMRPLHHIRH